MIKAMGGALLALVMAGSAAPPNPRHVPVFREDFADPFVIEHDGEYIAYATNRGLNLPMLTSRDLVNWRRVTDARGRPQDGMPVLAPWVREGRTWAPDVIRIGDKWLLYYTAHDARRDRQCVGVAVAADPKGPFRDASKEPFLCQDELGGTIDANPFRDADGQLYLYYKNDGNGLDPPKPARIWGQRLSADGLKLIGAPVPLVENDVHWEWRVVESPAMARTPAGYTLIFSGNHYGWEADQRFSNYATAFARCDTPLGPCRDYHDNPILESYHMPSAGCLSGPGHPALFTARGRTYIAFHAWSATETGCRKAANERQLYIAPLEWRSDGFPIIGPSLRRSGQ